jgi:hypothetical protein
MEILFAMVKGTDSSKVSAESPRDVSEPPKEEMMQMMGDWQSELNNSPGEDQSSASPEQNPSSTGSAEPKGSEFLLSAASFLPNLLGIKGLNHEIGEWVYADGQAQPSGDESKTRLYAVIGGGEEDPKDKNSLPSVVERFPWEGFEEIGFRTVEGDAVGDSAK